MYESVGKLPKSRYLCRADVCTFLARKKKEAASHVASRLRPNDEESQGTSLGSLHIYVLRNCPYATIAFFSLSIWAAVRMPLPTRNDRHCFWKVSPFGA